MAARFNPPPGWPPAPDGWLPPDGWQVPADLPAPPPGWQMVIDDEAPAGALPVMPGHGADPVVIVEGSYRVDTELARPAPPEPGVVWSAVGQPITGIGARRYKMDATTLYFEKGVLSTNAQQVPLVHIVDVDMRQSMTQKARGVGNVVLHVHRMRGIEIVVLQDIPEPRAAVTVINRAVTAARIVEQKRANTHHYNGQPPLLPPIDSSAPAPPPPAPPAAPDPIEQLRRLGELRDAGILTDEEFAAKKAEILSRL